LFAGLSRTFVTDARTRADVGGLLLDFRPFVKRDSRSAARPDPV